MPNKSVTVKVPAKINLQISVGPLQSDGFHELATVFQAVSLFDEVKISKAAKDSGITLKISGVKDLPTDSSNLAWRAAELMADKYGSSKDLQIEIKKEIPVAGGMAGGSANAAAVLIGLDALFDLKIARSELMSMGSTIGSDVPFSIMGNVAIGRGHGDQLNSVLSRGNYLWVLAFSNQGLSTPAVYKECDRLRAGMSITNPTINETLLQALASGDAKLLGKSLVNDLQAAACSLKPSLRLILDVGNEYGALGSIVSGSGPTVAFLVSDQDHALDLTVALSGSGVVSNAISVNAPVSGAKIIESF
jgi:4-diphosphocytidyl-2-C-methyl-D-erythritol kinase